MGAALSGTKFVVEYHCLIPSKHGVVRSLLVPNIRAIRLVLAYLDTDSNSWRAASGQEEVGRLGTARKVGRLLQLLSRNPKTARLLGGRYQAVRHVFRDESDPLWDPCTALGQRRVWVSRSAGLWGARMAEFDYRVEFGLFQAFESWDAFVFDGVPLMPHADSCAPKLDGSNRNGSDSRIREPISATDQLIQEIDSMPQQCLARARPLAQLNCFQRTRHLVLSDPYGPQGNSGVLAKDGATVAHGLIVFDRAGVPIQSADVLVPGDPQSPKVVWRPSDSRVLASIPPMRNATVEFDVFFLGPSMSWYHFLFEGLVHLRALEQVTGAMAPIVLQAGTPGQIVETCRRLTGKEPILLAPYEGLTASRVLMPSALLSTERCLPEPLELERLRDAFKGIDFLCEEHDHYEGVAIIRHRRQLRPLQNANRIGRVLQKAGMRLIDPEMLSLDQQASLFHSCDVVIAESGAALSNMLFMRPEATVIEIVPNLGEQLLWKELAKRLGIKHAAVYSNPQRLGRRGVLADGLSVDPRELRLALENAGWMSARRRLRGSGE